MAQNITLLGASYSNVPAVTLPKTGGGTARFDDTSDANAIAADISNGKTAYVNGEKVTGTATVGGESDTFVVTVTQNSQTTEWEPDCTYEEARAANQADKLITIRVNYSVFQDVVVDGEWSDYFEGLHYRVCERLYSASSDMVARTFIFTSYGLTELGEPDEYVVPPSLQSKSKSYTPSETAQSETVSADSGYDGLSSVAVSVGAISSTYVGSGITRRSSSDLTASGATVTVPAGYYSAQSSKAVASGTAGTPTATKGNVVSNSVTVTPSVTNTTGYITGGTKTGTGISVSASELVSGTLAINSSGTKDVTNYASATVEAGTTGTPTATKSSVSNHSVTVTPSVTNATGFINGGTKTGTAVSVSASELVSGNLNITANTTSTDVTNYATVSVAIPIVTYYTSTSNPSSSQGSNGDIWLVTG